MALDLTKAWLLPCGLFAMAQPVTPENGTDFQLPELYRMLECSTIEVVRLEDPPRWLIIDEEGKLKEKELNMTATVFSKLWPHDVIVGHAVMCPFEMLR